MILPQGTLLYRYCLETNLPDEWSPDFENPEYANSPNGKKNQIGAYFFYANEETACNVANNALEKFGIRHGIYNFTLTTCQTTRDITLLDLTGDMKPFPFLEELYNNGIDVLTDNFINYYKGKQLFSRYRDKFMQIMEQENPFLQENVNFHQNCQTVEQIWYFFTFVYGDNKYNEHILGQLVTDYANGHTFKRLLVGQGFEGYEFNEEHDCPTICIFEADKLSQPNHTLIERDNI